MIKYSIRGENLEVTEAIRDYVVSKLEKIEKYFQPEQEVAAGGETGGGVVAAGVTPGVVCVAPATSPAAGVEVVVVVVVAGGVALACAGALAGGRTRRTWPISITSGLGSCWFQRMMSRQSWLYSAAILRTVSPGRTVW